MNPTDARNRWNRKGAVKNRTMRTTQNNSPRNFKKKERVMNINDIPDHPIVQNMMGTGYPDGKEPTEMICPKCGEVCDFYYIDADREICGCENCISLYGAESFVMENE